MRSVVGFLLAVVACVTGCATSFGRSSSRDDLHIGAHDLHGQWVLEKVVDDGRTTEVPTSLDVYLMFEKNDEVRGFDGCSWFGGTLRRSSAGSVTASNVFGTANGCLSLPGALEAARGAIGAVLYGNRPMTISQTDNRLTIATSGRSLTYVPRSALRAAANAFRRLSAANGEPTPHDASYVVTTYKQADELLGHHRPLGRDGHQRVYLIAARGTFVGHHSQIPQRSIIFAVYNGNAALWEWGIRQTRPPLPELGRVVPLG